MRLRKENGDCSEAEEKGTLPFECGMLVTVDGWALLSLWLAPAPDPALIGRGEGRGTPPLYGGEKEGRTCLQKSAPPLTSQQ